MKLLARKGVKIVTMPTIFDINSVIAFLLINDHSIIVVKNPKKEIFSMLKLIIKKGFLFFKHNQPIKVNLTLWVLIEILPLVEKQKSTNNKPKKVTDMIQKEYGFDFLGLFEIIVDYS